SIPNLSSTLITNSTISRPISSHPMRSFIVLPINFLGEDIYLNRAACNHRSAQSDEQASFPVMRETNVPFLRGVAVILRRIADSTRFFVLDGEVEAVAFGGGRGRRPRSGARPRRR